jgi:hypothetical protein
MILSEPDRGEFSLRLRIVESGIRKVKGKHKFDLAAVIKAV